MSKFKGLTTLSQTEVPTPALTPTPTPTPRPTPAVTPTKINKFAGLTTLNQPQTTQASSPVGTLPTSKFKGLQTASTKLAEPAPAKAEPVTSRTVRQIGQQYNLSKEQIAELDSVKEYLGQQGQDRSPTGIAKQVAGTTGEMFLLGIPQWLYKKSQDDPNMRAALDDMQTRIDAQKSWLQFGSELAGGLGGALKLSKTAASAGGKATKLYDPLAAVGSGATLGLTQSKEGDEFKDAAIGGAIGAGAVLGIAGVGALYRGAVKLPEAYLKKEIDRLAIEAPQLEQAISKAAVDRADEIQEINKIITKSPIALKDTETFLTVVPAEIRKKLVSKDELTRFMNDIENKKLLLKADGTPLPLSEIEGVAVDLISETKVRGIASQVISLIGETRSLSTIMKETPEYFSRMAQDTDEFTLSTLNRAWSTTLAKEAIPEIRKFKTLPGLNAIQRASLFVSDGKFMSKVIDERMGLTGNNSLELVLDKGSQALNTITSVMETPLKRINEVNKALVKSKTESPEAIYKALDEGTNLGEVTAQYKELFTYLRNTANEMGGGIQEIKNYVPKLRLPFVEYRSKLKQVVADTLGVKELNIQALSEEDFLKLKGTSNQNKLLTEIESLSNSKINNVDELKFNLQSLLRDSSSLNDALRTTSFAQAVRTGGIPDWALDKNVTRLALRWTQNTFQHLALRDTVRDLTSVSQIADKAGQTQIALYVRNLTADVLGRRKGTLDFLVKRSIENTQANLIEKSEKTNSTLLKYLYQGAASFVDLMPVMQQQAYPNFLGLNPKSAGQNVMGFFYQNTPELGGELGGRAVLEASVDVAAFFKKGGNMGKYLVDQKILPKQWDGEMVEALKSGVQEASAVKLTRAALNASTKTLMFAFTKAEQLARLQTHFQAKRLSKYIMDDPRLAEKLRTRISSQTYRTLIGDAIDKKNPQLLEEHMDRYLQSTNLFNYDKINMSEYGRFMGPLFSMFSKWPTATAGKLAHYYFNGINTAGSIRIAQTLVVPFAMAKLYDGLIAPPPGDSVYYDKLIGKKGLANWMPLSSLPLDVSLKDGLLAAPVPSAVVAGSKALSSDNPVENTRTWFNTMLMSFSPGAGWLRFVGEDIPEYSTGRDFDKVKPLGE